MFVVWINTKFQEQPTASVSILGLSLNRLPNVHRIPLTITFHGHRLTFYVEMWQLFSRYCIFLQYATYCYNSPRAFVLFLNSLLRQASHIKSRCVCVSRFSRCVIYRHRHFLLAPFRLNLISFIWCHSTSKIDLAQM